MPPDVQISVTSLHLLGIDDLRRRSRWFLWLGILLVILGAVCLSLAVFVTLASMVFFGLVMIAAGLFQTLHALAGKAWGGFVVDLLSGLLSLVVGILVVTHPGSTAVAISLLIAFFLIVSGLFRIAVVLSIPFHHRVWLLIHGAISLLLGVSIWMQPSAGVWLIGFVIGLDMLFNGWSLIMLGLMAKKMPLE